LNKSIETLVEDIHEVLLNGSENVTTELCDEYGHKFAELLKSRFGAPREVKRGTLRMSNIGSPCERKLYYSVNTPEDGEELPASTIFKFSFGDTIELLLLFLSQAAGHSVEGTQDTQEIEGIKGHRDAVIDGVIIDVKSASTYSYQKFASGTLEQGNDAFGYIDQLQSYLYAGQSDPKVIDKSRAGFLVADKTLGHICLDIHEKKSIPYDLIYKHKKEMVAAPNEPPRGFTAVPDGKSGNEKLGVNCSYCDFKDKCWPGLQTYIYSTGPRYLTKVVREPKVEQHG